MRQKLSAKNIFLMKTTSRREGYTVDRSIFAQIADQFTDESRLQSWLDVESALARSQARLKIIPDRAARDIAEKCYLEELQVDRYQEMYRKPSTRWFRC